MLHLWVIFAKLKSHVGSILGRFFFPVSRNIYNFRIDECFLRGDSLKYQAQIHKMKIPRSCPRAARSETFGGWW